MTPDSITSADDVRAAITQGRHSDYVIFEADGHRYRVMRLRHAPHPTLTGTGLDAYTALLILPDAGPPILLERPATDRDRWARFVYQRAGHSMRHWPAACALLDAFGWTRRDRDERAALARAANR